MRNGLLSFAVVLGLAMAATADEKVPLDKVPAKVLEAAKAKFPKATLVSASKEDEDHRHTIDELHRDKRGVVSFHTRLMESKVDPAHFAPDLFP